MSEPTTHVDDCVCDEKGIDPDCVSVSQIREWASSMNAAGTESCLTAAANLETHPTMKFDTDGAPMILMAKFTSDYETAKKIHDALMWTEQTRNKMPTFPDWKI